MRNARPKPDQASQLDIARSRKVRHEFEVSIENKQRELSSRLMQGAALSNKQINHNSDDLQLSLSLSPSRNLKRLMQFLEAAPLSLQVVVL